MGKVGSGREVVAAWTLVLRKKSAGFQLGCLSSSVLVPWMSQSKCLGQPFSCLAVGFDLSSGSIKSMIEISINVSSGHFLTTLGFARVFAEVWRIPSWVLGFQRLFEANVIVELKFNLIVPLHRGRGPTSQSLYRDVFVAVPAHAHNLLLARPEGELLLVHPA